MTSNRVAFTIFASVVFEGAPMGSAFNPPAEDALLPTIASEDAGAAWAAHVKAAWQIPQTLQPYLDAPAAVFDQISQGVFVLLQWSSYICSCIFQLLASLDLAFTQWLALHLLIFVLFYVFASPLRAKKTSRESLYDFFSLYATGVLFTMAMYHSSAGWVDICHYFLPAALVAHTGLLVLDCLARVLFKKTLRYTFRTFLVNANVVTCCMCAQYAFCQSPRSQMGGLANSLIGWASYLSMQYSVVGEGSRYCAMLQQPKQLPFAMLVSSGILSLWSLALRHIFGRGLFVLGPSSPRQLPQIVTTNAREKAEDVLLKQAQCQRAMDAKQLLDERPTMCPWYSHRVAFVGIDMFLTVKIFLGRFDARLMRATMERASNKCQQKGINRKFASRDELWFDFVADTGDGFNSTYAIARSLAQLNLSVKETQFGRRGIFGGIGLGTARGELTLPRGELLIHGGDLAYPTPSMQCYEERLFRPWEAALPSPPGVDPLEVAESMQSVSEEVAENNSSPTCWMIPGNHDWFDGLEAFLHMICGRHWIGGWHLPQTNTYWALELSHDWYVFGIDLALTDDFDDAQYSYFREISAGLPQHANVIVLCHQPYWLNDAYYVRPPTLLYSRLGALLGPKLRVRLAGDIHNYMHHTPKPPNVGPELVISGGGGAFLHPTHLNIEIPGYQESAVYPSKVTSRRIVMTNPWMFRARNLSIEMCFGLLCCAMVYGIVPLCGDAELALESLRTGTKPLDVMTRIIFRAYAHMIADTTTALLAHLLLLFGCLNFVEKQWGSARAFVYGLVLFGVLSLAAVTCACGLELAMLTLSEEGHMKLKGPNADPPAVIKNLSEPWDEICIYAFRSWIAIYDLPSHVYHARKDICAAVGPVSRFTEVTFLLGVPFFWVIITPLFSFLFGAYLALMSLLGRHLDESFSSLRIADYKNFLRMHIDKKGTLTIYAIGIDNVPRNWVDDPDFSEDSGSKRGQFTPSRWKPAGLMSTKLVDKIVLKSRSSAPAPRPGTKDPCAYSSRLPRSRTMSFSGH